MFQEEKAIILKQKHKSQVIRICIVAIIFLVFLISDIACFYSSSWNLIFIIPISEIILWLLILLIEIRDFIFIRAQLLNHNQLLSEPRERKDNYIYGLYALIALLLMTQIVFESILLIEMNNINDTIEDCFFFDWDDLYFQYIVIICLLFLNSTFLILLTNSFKRLLQRKLEQKQLNDQESVMIISTQTMRHQGEALPVNKKQNYASKNNSYESVESYIQMKCQSKDPEPSQSYVLSLAFSWRSYENKSDNCALCQTGLYLQSVIQIKCGHQFHKDCFESQVKQQGFCPFCPNFTTNL